jgi:hypothetical protein
LSDGRPLAQAAVVANPSLDLDASGVVPRPEQARTADDGGFQMELDQGRYNIRVDPQVHTGFPRLVTMHQIEGDAQDLGTLKVPLPVRLSFTVKGPDPYFAPVNPVVGAIVRIFAVPEAGSHAVEIGMAMTNSDGLCEIPLAKPR